MMGIYLAVLPTLGCASAPKRDTEQSQVRYQLAVGYFQDKRLEAAIDELNKSLKEDPENADAYSMLGIIALRQGHDYLVQLETVACLKGQDATLVRQDAIRKFRHGEQQLRKAVALRPGFSAAWNNLAVVALQLDDWDLAIEAATNALKDVAYPQPEIARANLGWAYFNKKKITEAWKELHEAVSRYPGFCVGHYRLAKVYMERSEFDSAAEEIQAVVDTKACEGIQEAYLLGGLVEDRRKNREQARALFARCVQVAPRSCVAAECKRYTQLIQ